MFPDEISICISGLSKAFAFPSVGGHHPIHEGLSRTKRWRKEEFGPSCLGAWAGTSIFSCPWCFYFSGLQTQLESIPPAPLVLRPLDLDWTTPLAFLGLQLVDGRLWGLFNRYSSVSQFLIISLFTFVSIYFLLVLFLQSALTNTHSKSQMESVRFKERAVSETELWPNCQRSRQDRGVRRERGNTQN